MVKEDQEISTYLDLDEMILSILKIEYSYQFLENNFFDVMIDKILDCNSLYLNIECLSIEKNAMIYLDLDTNNNIRYQASIYCLNDFRIAFHKHFHIKLSDYLYIFFINSLIG